MESDHSTESIRSDSVKTPRARGKVTPVATNAGTIQRIITYACPFCGLTHRVIELGPRRSACHRGLVLVVAGGVR